MAGDATHLGRGSYSLNEAARLLRVSPNTLRWWTGERIGATPVIHREFPKQGILTFAEFIELQFVKMFRDERVSLQVIRRAAQAAARRFQTDYPFSVKAFDTDGRSIFATLIREDETEFVEDLRHGQYVFSRFIKPFFRKLKYRGGHVGQLWPLGKDSRIVLDPERRSGAPIDAETGVPVETMITALNAGDGQDEQTVAEWLGVPLEAVQAAIEFQNSLVA